MEPQEHREIFKERVRKLANKILENTYEITKEMNPTLDEITSAFIILVLNMMINNDDLDESTVKKMFERMLHEYCVIKRENKDSSPSTETAEDKSKRS